MIAHEWGHYLLHRDRQLETQADQFASALLMPPDDFRRQVDRQLIGANLLSHCADQHGASPTAAALKWIDVAPERAMLFASGEDHLL